MKPVLLICRDFLFASRILETARQLGVEVAQEKEGVAAGIDGGAFERAIVDLTHPAALSSLGALRASSPDLRITAFVRHDDVDSIRAAREAGASEVLARSAFSERLPTILRPHPNGADGGAV